MQLTSLYFAHTLNIKAGLTTLVWAGREQHPTATACN